MLYNVVLVSTVQQSASAIHVHISPPFGVSLLLRMGFPGGLAVNNPPANAGDLDSIPESGRSPGEENDNSLQYSCQGNPMDRGAWWATVHGVTKELHTT